MYQKNSENKNTIKIEKDAKIDEYEEFVMEVNVCYGIMNFVHLVPVIYA